MNNFSASAPAHTHPMNAAVRPQPPFRVLVVIPTLGQRLETLHRTLSSIHDQTEILVDIVVVSQTLTTQLADIAAQFKAQIVVHPGHISAAVNAGFATAIETHRYAAWLGDDDMLRPGALANASMLLEHSPEASVVYGSCDYIDMSGKLLFERRPPAYAPVLLQFVPGLIKQEACLFRLSSLNQIGGLDEKLKYTMDLDILLRLRRSGAFIKSKKIHAAFCWHSESLTISNRMASLVEAQNVQSRNVRGFSRIIFSVIKYPIKYLILTINWKINRNQSGVFKKNKD